MKITWFAKGNKKEQVNVFPTDDEIFDKVVEHFFTEGIVGAIMMAAEELKVSPLYIRYRWIEEYSVAKLSDFIEMNKTLPPDQQLSAFQTGTMYRKFVDSVKQLQK